MPKWCKNLVDLLKPSAPDPDEVIRRFIHLVLLQTQHDRATKLIIGVASNAGTTIRYQVDDTWHDMAPFPSDIRPRVISELARMANFPEQQISGEGILNENLARYE